MKVQNWKIPYAQPEIPETLRAAGYAPLLAAMLHVRGIDTVEQAEAFVHGDDSQLHDPMLLYGMDRAVERLSRAIASGEEVAVFGSTFATNSLWIMLVVTVGIGEIIACGLLGLLLYKAISGDSRLLSMITE